MISSPNKRKTKSLAFFIRIFTLIIFIAAVVVSTVFSTNYITNNSKESIDFAGGYQTQVQYDGKANQTQIKNMLEHRVDPLGTSNVKIEQVKSAIDTKYNLALSKDADVSMSSFIHSVSRRGYIYILDEAGHDLFANQTDKDKKWTPRDKRIKTSDFFGSITDPNNPNSHLPEVHLAVKDSKDLSAISDVAKDSQLYVYSDIGQLLDYIRNSMTGLQELVNIINQVKSSADPDVAKRADGLTWLLANNTNPFEGNGTAIINAVTNNDPRLQNLLQPMDNDLDVDGAKGLNGQYGINWVYSDNINSITPLSVDPNDDANVFDPNNPFDQSTGKGSPMNAWLPYINQLIRIKDISDFLQKDVLNYNFAPYWIGPIGKESIQNNNIVISSEEFSQAKVEQIKSVLTAGLSKNNFTVLSYFMVKPTLGAQAIKFVIIALLAVLAVLAVIILFYYRLMGFVALIVISLFLVFTLVSFTFVNGIVAPETGIALVIAFALLLDCIVNLLERLKNEYSQGKTISNAFKSANKKSLSYSLDCNVLILIISLTIFWFGTRAIKGFVIMTSIATFGVIIFGIVLFRLILWLMLHKNWLENKPQVLGISFKKNKKIEKLPIENKEDTNLKKVTTAINSPTTPVVQKTAKFLNFKEWNFFNRYPKWMLIAAASLKKVTTTVKKKTAPIVEKTTKILNVKQWNFFHRYTKWILVASAAIVVVSGVTYGVIGANFGSGFDQRTDFIGEGTITDTSDLEIYTVAKQASDKIKNLVINSDYKKYFKDINIAFVNEGITSSATYELTLLTSLNNSNLQSKFNEFLNQNSSILNLAWGETVAVYAQSGHEMFLNMIIAIAISFIAIAIYIFIRFQLTYVLPLILSIVIGLVLSLSIICLAHITISSSIIGILLGVMVLIIIGIMVVFDNIREMKLGIENQENLTKEQIINLSNASVKKTLPRTLFINSIILLTGIIVMIAVPTFWAVGLSIILGALVSLVITFFIAPYLWTYFERWRLHRYKKRLSKIKKHFIGPDEYIIEGINE